MLRSGLIEFSDTADEYVVKGQIALFRERFVVVALYKVSNRLFLYYSHERTEVGNVEFELANDNDR